MDPVAVPSWLQAGGLLAFATAVWWELRGQRAIIEGIRDALVASLERDRIRDSDLTPTHGTPVPPSFRRPRTPARGVDVVDVARLPLARARSRAEDDE